MREKKARLLLEQTEHIMVIYNTGNNNKTCTFPVMNMINIDREAHVIN